MLKATKHEQFLSASGTKPCWKCPNIYFNFSASFDLHFQNVTASKLHECSHGSAEGYQALSPCSPVLASQSM